MLLGYHTQHHISHSFISDVEKITSLLMFRRQLLTSGPVRTIGNEDVSSFRKRAHDLLHECRSLLSIAPIDLPSERGATILRPSSICADHLRSNEAMAMLAEGRVSEGGGAVASGMTLMEEIACEYVERCSHSTQAILEEWKRHVITNSFGKQRQADDGEIAGTLSLSLSASLSSSEPFSVSSSTSVLSSVPAETSFETESSKLANVSISSPQLISSSPITLLDATSSLPADTLPIQASDQSLTRSEDVKDENPLVSEEPINYGKTLTESASPSLRQLEESPSRYADT